MYQIKRDWKRTIEGTQARIRKPHRIRNKGSCYERDTTAKM